MEDDFNTIDELIIITMLNDYIAQCIQEQTPQCIINEMVKSKEKLMNFIHKNS
jgi:hypothetical protein